MILRAVLATGLALTLSGCAADRAPADSPAIAAAARGHAVAMRICAECHAIAPNAVSPNPRAPGFATLEMRHTVGLDDRLATLTRLGHYGMPPQKLTPDQVQDLVSYIEGPDARSR